MRRKVLVMMTAVMFVVSSYAAVSVTKNLAGTVTIAVDGEAGQIGKEITNQSGNTTYDYASGILEADTLIKNAGALVITGNINSTDIKALVQNNQSDNIWTLNTLDMGGATIDSIKVKTNDSGDITSHDFLPQSYMKIDCMSLTLPVASDGILPDYFGFCLTNELTSVTFPDGYTYLGDNAFTGKSKLKSVKLPGSLESIGKEAFQRTALEEITFPNTLKSIDDNAFEECLGLKTVSFPADFEKLGNNVFFNVPQIRN